MNKNKKERQGSIVKFFKKKPYAYINQTVQTKAEDRTLNTNSSFLLKARSKNRGNSTKKDKGANPHHSNSISHFQYLGTGNLNNRCFTESYSNKGMNNSDGLCKKKAERSLFSPQSKIYHKKISNKSNDRLSLNASKKRINPSQNEDAQFCIRKGSMCLTELEKQRKNIQKDIKRVILKQKIEKKEVLKITQKYERLIDRIALSEMVSNKDIAEFDTKYFANSTHSPNQHSDASSTVIVRETKENVQQLPSKSKVCFGLQLKNLKSMKIQDYHDEFMSHYDQLSESWKRELTAQQRY